MKRIIFLRKGEFFLLTSLFLISFFIRTYRLDSYPYGFHEDEAYIGYNAYSLLKTGHDKDNKFLPLAIDQFGDFRPSGLHFLTIPFVGLFGLTVFTTRLPAALFGSLTVFILYFLTFEIFKNKKIAFIASGLLAITPWHIIASRSTSESIVAMFFMILGIYSLLKFLNVFKLRLAYLYLSFISFFCSFLFYHAVRLFVPLFLIYIYICISNLRFRYSSRKIRKGIYTTYSLLLFILLIFIFIFSHGNNRPSEISIFADPAIPLINNEQRIEDFKAHFLPHLLFHTRLTGYVNEFINNYLQHFSPDFLFLKGGYPQRYMIPSTGNFYLVEGIFFLVGFAFLLSNCFKKKEYIFSLEIIPLVWLFLGPIPAAFTYEDIPHFQRSILMLPAFLIISACGIHLFIAAFKNIHAQWISLLTVSLFLLSSFISFNYNYFIHGFIHRPIYRSEGEQELIVSLNKIAGKKTPIIMTSQNGNRLIFYLFFNKIDPFYFQKVGSPRQRDQTQFLNLHFTDDHCPAGGNSKSFLATIVPGTIYVNAGECYTQPNVMTIKEIRRPDDTIAFKILKL